MESFYEWRDYKGIMRMWFGHPNLLLTKKFDGRNDLHDHLAKWTNVYGIDPRPEGVHLFCHTLDIIPMNCYLETELYHGTTKRDILREGFFMTFSFEYGFKRIDEVL